VVKGGDFVVQVSDGIEELLACHVFTSLG
jgi:hypothetical protein